MFKKLKYIGGLFKKNFKGMVKNDFEKMQDDALIGMWNRVKFIFGSIWNGLIDSICFILLKSAMNDAEEIIIQCKKNGEDPMEFLPRNLVRRLDKK